MHFPARSRIRRLQPHAEAERVVATHHIVAQRQAAEQTRFRARAAERARDRDAVHAGADFAGVGKGVI